MKKLYTLIIASAFAMIFNTALIAGESGVSIGAVFNSATIDTDGSNWVSKNAQMDRKSLSKDSSYGSVFIEYNAVGDSGFGVSAGFEVTPGDLEVGSGSRVDTGDEDDSDAGTYKAKAVISSPKLFYFEPTFMFNDSLGLFLKGGVSHVTFKEADSSGDRTTRYKSKDVFGGTYGIGAKATHPSGLFVKAEGIMTKWANFTTNNTLKESELSIDSEQKSIRLAVGFSF